MPPSRLVLPPVWLRLLRRHPAADHQSHRKPDLPDDGQHFMTRRSMLANMVGEKPGPQLVRIAESPSPCGTPAQQKQN